MNKKTTIYLVFVTLLALLLNLVFTLYFLDLGRLLSFIGVDSTGFVVFIISLSTFAAISSFLFSEVIARFMLGVTLIKQPCSERGSCSTRWKTCALSRFRALPSKRSPLRLTVTTAKRPGARSWKSAIQSGPENSCGRDPCCEI